MIVDQNQMVALGGLKILEQFNQSLLAQRKWRNLQEPNNLWCMVLHSNMSIYALPIVISTLTGVRENSHGGGKIYIKWIGSKMEWMK